MERAIELFVAITSLAVGASHLLRPDDWVETFQRMHSLGRAGAFLNGGLSLLPGALIVAGLRTWDYPHGALTLFGWLLVVKGAFSLVFPDVALASMKRNPSRHGFAFAGVALIGVGVWATYCALERT